MLYYIFKWLDEHYDVSGARLFEFISFRAAMAMLLSLFISTIYGRSLINFLKRRQIGETVRDLGLSGEDQKKGTPTMGGIIILLSILIPTILLADVKTVYIWLMILCTVWLGIIGFVDDYLKLKARKDAKERGENYKKMDSHGLAGITKLIGQVGLGIIIGVTLYFNSSVTVEREVIGSGSALTEFAMGETQAKDSNIITREIDGQKHRFAQVKTPITTIPFVKDHEFNYSRLISWIGPGLKISPGFYTYL